MESALSSVLYRGNAQRTKLSQCMVMQIATGKIYYRIAYNTDEAKIMRNQILKLLSVANAQRIVVYVY